MTHAFVYKTPSERPPLIQNTVSILKQLMPGVDYRICGSQWPTYLITGETLTSSDIDVRISWDDWQHLPRSTRQQFILHEPHARYLKALWKARSGRPEHAKYSGMVDSSGLPKDNVWVLRSSAEITSALGVPLELIVSRHLAPAETLTPTMTLDHLQMIDSPQGLYVTERALRSIEHQTIVWRHIRDTDDIGRGMMLAAKHADRLHWPIVIPPENGRWFGIPSFVNDLPEL